MTHTASHEFIKALAVKLNIDPKAVELVKDDTGWSTRQSVKINSFFTYEDLEFRIYNDHLRTSSSVYAGVKTHRFKVELRPKFPTWQVRHTNYKFFIQKFGDGELERTIERINKTVAWAKAHMAYLAEKEDKAKSEAARLSSMAGTLADKIGPQSYIGGTAAEWHFSGKSMNAELKLIASSAKMEISVWGDPVDPTIVDKLTRIKAIIEE